MDHKKYLLVWTTKYRRPVLQNQEAYRIREVIREICKNLNVDIIQGAIRKDHIKIVVSVPHDLPLPTLLRHIKGKSAHVMLSENQGIQQAFPQRHLWAKGYYAKVIF